MIEIPKDTAKEALNEWDKMEGKYSTFKNWTHGGTVNFKCKYPAILKLMKIIGDSK